MSALNSPPALARVNGDFSIEVDNQHESCLHPYQPIEHNLKFNLTPTNHRDSNDEMGDLKSSADDQMTPFNFDEKIVSDN